mmetsp:Transcript_7632/g.13831  ORF Transcript_7632/g.13831 Transcript_7632/m.13831 type:complete len:109 (-) Transcript_7632:42-368(-)
MSDIDFVWNEKFQLGSKQVDIRKSQKKVFFRTNMRSLNKEKISSEEFTSQMSSGHLKGLNEVSEFSEISNDTESPKSFRSSSAKGVAVSRDNSTLRKLQKSCRLNFKV